jgi:hypothetical protein
VILGSWFLVPRAAFLVRSLGAVVPGAVFVRTAPVLWQGDAEQVPQQLGPGEHVGPGIGPRRHGASWNQLCAFDVGATEAGIDSGSRRGWERLSWRDRYR